MRQTDTWVGLTLAILAGAVLFFIVPTSIPDRTVGGMSVALFPKILLILIIALSVLLIIRSVVSAASFPSPAGLQNVSLDIVLLLTLPASYLVIEYLGISLFALIITPPVMIVFGQRRWAAIATTAVCLAVAARLVVVELLQRPPLGIW